MHDDATKLVMDIVHAARDWAEWRAAARSVGELHPTEEALLAAVAEAAKFVAGGQGSTQ